ncbi:MAG: hypothetical protein QXG00_00505 [Candidatus Woesearchaeota archaeon]
MNKNVTQIREYIGNAELSFFADFKTAVELDNFLFFLRVKYPDIEDYEVMLITNN